MLVSNGKEYQGEKALDKKYPITELQFSNNDQNGKLHPTQKPVALFEYLIKTYTNEGDLVLDNCAGSGTTGVACKNLNRNFILIEKEQEYIDIINKRLAPIRLF
jgi:site-specific DNA-methyltransferase (adenine-specific)